MRRPVCAPSRRWLPALGIVVAMMVATACGDDATPAEVGGEAAIGAPIAVNTRDEGNGSLVSANQMPLLDRRITSVASQAVRVEYRSSSAIDGSNTVVSGAVFVPLGNAPTGGWPVVAVGHGTTGVLGECAPTLDPQLYGSSELVSALLRLGYVVTLPDYQGLGTPNSTSPTHPYLDNPTTGRNVIDSVRAARRIAPDTSDRWAAIGLSQGGGAVWSANEQSAAYGRELDLLGTASVSPAADMAPIVAKARRGQLTRDQEGVMQWLLLALSHENPNLDLDLYRRGVVKNRWNDLSQCSPTRLTVRDSAVAAITPDDLRPETAQASAALTSLIARRSVGAARTAAPVFVAYGGKDTLVDAAWTADAISRACRRGDTIETSFQPDRGHIDTDPDGALAWLQGRFSGAPTKSSCGAA